MHDQALCSLSSGLPRAKTTPRFYEWDDTKPAHFYEWSASLPTDFYEWNASLTRSDTKSAVWCEWSASLPTDFFSEWSASLLQETTQSLPIFCEWSVSLPGSMTKPVACYEWSVSFPKSDNNPVDFINESLYSQASWFLKNVPLFIIMQADFYEWNISLPSKSDAN